MIVEDLEDVPPGWPEDSDGESHALLNHANLVRLDSNLAKLGGDLQNAQLRNCNREGRVSLTHPSFFPFFLKKNIVSLLPTNEEVAVGVVESPILH